jgi:hypothetical protein
MGTPRARYHVQEEPDDDLDEDDDFEEDEEGEEDDEEDEEVETWQVSGLIPFPLKYGLSLTSRNELPRLAPNSSSAWDLQIRRTEAALCQRGQLRGYSSIRDSASSATRVGSSTFSTAARSAAPFSNCSAKVSESNSLLKILKRAHAQATCV